MKDSVLVMMKINMKMKEIDKIKTEIKKLKFLAEDLMDIPYGSIDSSCRKRDYTIARMATSAFVMFEMGLTMQQAKDYFERHRTSFYFYKKKHIEFMESPKFNPRYNDFYDKLVDIYMNDDERLFKTKRSFQFFQEIENARKEQQAINKRLRELDREAKRIGL